MPLGRTALCSALVSSHHPMYPLTRPGLPCHKTHHCSPIFLRAQQHESKAATRTQSGTSCFIKLHLLHFLKIPMFGLLVIFSPNFSYSKLITSACNTTAPSFALYLSWFTVNSDEKKSVINVYLNFNFSCYRHGYLTTALLAAEARHLSILGKQASEM